MGCCARNTLDRLLRLTYSRDSLLRLKYQASDQPIGKILRVVAFLVAGETDINFQIAPRGFWAEIKRPQTHLHVSLQSTTSKQGIPCYPCRQLLSRLALRSIASEL